jgi:hypothetical protein
MRTAFITALIVFSAAHSVAQIQEPCAAHVILREQIKENPALRQVIDAYERRLSSMKVDADAQSETVYTIPVVFHIVYHRADQNVSDAQIAEQIAVLNRDFAGGNPNTMGLFSPTLRTDVKVQFALARTAPDGSTTSGIERRQTNVEQFDSYNSRTNDNMKHYETGGLDAWDPNVYLNIWVAPLSNVGFARFPTLVDDEYGAVLDPWVIPLGESTIDAGGHIGSHEVGHCLSLYHTWGDDAGSCTGSDNVDDTPNHADNSQYYGVGFNTEEGVLITDSCATSSPGVMYMNFMDYGNDRCYANFTPGQKSRMRVNLTSGGTLLNLASSTAYELPSNCTAPSSPRARSITRTSATLQWTPMQNASGYNVRYRKVGATTWITASSTTASLNITGLSRRTSYEFQVQTVGASCTSAFSAVATFSTPFYDPPTSLGSPTLTYPANGASGISADTSLIWGSVSSASRYRCELSTSSSFSDPVVFVVTSTAVGMYRLMYGTTYYWRVKAMTDDIEGAWSTVRSFTVVQSTLNAPTVIKPANSATDLGKPVMLVCSKISDALSYEFQISQNADMSSATTLFRRLQTTTRHELAYGTTYYWRVRSSKGTQTSAWSDVWSFTTADSTLLPPRPILPGNNSQENPTSLNLTWKPNPSASTYDVQISTSNAFTGATTVNTADTMRSVAGLTGGTQYFWRVRSVNVNGSSGWSTTRYFTTQSTLTQLSAPSLIAPGNNSTNVSRTPTLSWNGVSNATSYTVQYSTSSSMSPNTELTTASTSIAIGTLAGNTTYYWRVKATASGYSDSDWSATWNFKTVKGGKAKESVPGPSFEDNDPSVTINLFPNPSDGSATLHVIVHTPGRLRLSIATTVGATMPDLFDSDVEVGELRIPVDAFSLASGPYVVRAVINDALVAIPMIIVK